MVLPLTRPIFIIGCGRSGTTFLGSAMAQHRAVAYLNEPRQLWARSIPSSDIWSAGSVGHRGKIVLDRLDCPPGAAQSLRGAFETVLARSGRQRFCEKLPINAFRLPLLDHIFPDALYLYLERDGIAVARSIAKRAETGPWFGAGDRKWLLLTELAERDATLGALARACVSGFHRGLLEWVLSSLWARRFLAAVPGRTITVRYDELVDAPAATADRIERFCDLPRTGEISIYLAGTARHNPLPSPATPPDTLAMDLLARRSALMPPAEDEAAMAEVGLPAKSPSSLK